ncbi:MAG: NUDIX domain-containing protein, partial [Rhizobiales bacterium]|nr:NUDIX domain-containing protein [Hyphomicrobiales bacterium]
PHPNPLPTGERGMRWRRLSGVVTHTFTHFPLELIVYRADVTKGTAPPRGARWVPLGRLAGEALPNVMRKVIAHAVDSKIAIRESHAQ